MEKRKLRFARRQRRHKILSAMLRKKKKNLISKAFNLNHKAQDENIQTLNKAIVVLETATHTAKLFKNIVYKSRERQFKKYLYLQKKKVKTRNRRRKYLTRLLKTPLSGLRTKLLRKVKKIFKRLKKKKKLLIRSKLIHRKLDRVVMAMYKIQRMPIKRKNLKKLKFNKKKKSKKKKSSIKRWKFNPPRIRILPLNKKILRKVCYRLRKRFSVWPFGKVRKAIRKLKKRRLKRLKKLKLRKLKLKIEKGKIEKKKKEKINV